MFIMLFLWNIVIAINSKKMRQRKVDSFSRVQQKLNTVHVSAFSNPQNLFHCVPYLKTNLVIKQIDKLFVFRDSIDCGYNYAFCFSNLLSNFWLFTNRFSVILPFHPKYNLVSLSCDNQMLAIYVSNYDATSTCQPTSKTKQDYQNSISKSA